MKLRSFLILFLVFGLLTGCASKNFKEPGIASVSEEPTRSVFRGSYADVWSAATAALEKVSYPLATSQQESGLMLTDWIIGKSDRLYSGYGETRIPYRIRFKFSLRFQPSRDGVSVSITNEEEYLSDSVTAGTDFTGSLYQWIATKSSTLKESALLKEIQVQLTKSAARPKGR